MLENHRRRISEPQLKKISYIEFTVKRKFNIRDFSLGNIERLL